MVVLPFAVAESERRDTAVGILRNQAVSLIADIQELC
jgi:hypothetical protein